MLRKILNSALLLFLLLLFPFSSKAVNNYTKYSSNPILSPTANSWDEERVWQPSVVYDGSEYKMYYSAYNGSRFQIGLAHSVDGINWNKDINNPIVTRLNIDNKDSHDPNVIYDGSSYYMWYVSSDNGGSSNFAIQRAYSSNGINWINDPILPVMKFTSGWGSAQGVSSPSVLKVGTEFKMWFSSPDNGPWSTGLSNSLDGITWISQPQNPIITPSESWEDGQSANPDVTYDGAKFRMYYGGISHIAYADSNDGIIWNKPTENNPVLSSSQPFDLNRLGNASSIYLSNNTHALYYDGNGNVNGTTTWRIGVALDGPLPPTPTPSPTPLPTPTLTPTPTPNISRKVVVIPGFAASWNLDAFANCKTESIQGPWVLHPGEKNIYPSLYNSLTNAGYTPIPFYYDWRQPLGSQNSNLAEFINANTSPNETVDIVGHSFGGLVGRAYLTDHPINSRVNKYLSAGSPHNGVVQTYPAWTAGEIINSDFKYKANLEFILLLCKLRYRVNTLEAIHRYMPSIQDMLPTFPYLRDSKSNQLKPLGLMQTINSWLSSHPFPPTNTSLTIGTLTGTGQQTLASLVTKNPSKNDIQNGKWVDGKVIKHEFSANGDGTVLASSSQLNNADNRIISGSHTSIIDSVTGQQEIISFLGGTPTAQSMALRSEPKNTKKKAITFVLSYPAHTTLTDPKGKTMTDSEGLIAIDDPTKGRYSLSVTPKKFGNTKIIIAQFYEDGKYFWKEYNHWLPIRKNMKFFINPTSPSEDIEAHEDN